VDRIVVVARSALVALIALATTLTWIVAGPPAHAVVVPAALPVPAASPAIVFNEIAASSSRSAADSFFELKNISDEAVDLSGWGVYRCSKTGLRAKRGYTETEMSGVVLEPGEVYTAGRVGVILSSGRAPDAVFSSPFASTGFGLYLEDPDARLVDAVAVYPSEPTPMTTECSGRGNLPNALAAGLDESWQRVGTTGNASADFVRATATPGEADAAMPASVPDGGVRIDEIAAAGPKGSADDVVEIRNAGPDDVDVSGWRLYRCTARGELSADTLQLTLPQGTVLAPDDRYLVGGPDYSPSGDEREADSSTRTSLADTVSGVLLTTAEGGRVDGVTVSNHLDTACQTGDEKLSSTLDFRTGESWQRHPVSGGFSISSRTPGARNRSIDAAPASAADAQAWTQVAISEFAVDPAIEPAPAGFVRHHFIELGNYGSTPADIGGWRIIGCRVDGFRDTDTLVTVPDGITIEPGGTWVTALAGTAAADRAGAVLSKPLDFLGAGVWIEDADGHKVDSVGAYHANEMDFSLERQSPCSNGLSLSTFAPDRLIGETYQRARFTGVDADDFVAAVATPGRIDERAWREPAKLTATAAERLRGRADTLVDRVSAVAESDAVPADARAATLLEAFAGASADGPLVERVGDGERRIEPSPSALRTADDGYDFPYIRMTAAVSPDTPFVVWRGAAVDRTEVRLSVWNEASRAWRALDSASGPTSSGVLTLSGVIRSAELSGGRAEILVQSVPRTTALIDRPDGAFADPGDYDLAVSHLTDTQYLTEAYPEVYAEEVGWILANRDLRKIAFATHTGDLVQNWVDPDQTEPRARREFEIASEIQGMLDEAAMPNSVLPGNHDNKRGITNELFNDYFGPSRYIDAAWYGGSITPADNSANFSTFERAGARFLMLSLPYAFGERELEWAEDIVARHPDHNVIVSTHEHVTPASPDSPVGRSVGSRWVSRGGELWERVVAPNRNVVAVLSGHFHGLGRIVTEDAGGIEGHTVVEMVADYQEFRTHSGERSTGFQRLLQLDLAGGRIAVDTFSSNLGAHASFPYDYEQFVPENGRETSATNARPWNVLAAGLQDRYSAEDDDFGVTIRFQYAKAVITEGVFVAE